MKQILITSVLIVVIVLAAIGCDCYLLHECAELTDLLENPEETSHIERITEIWEGFSDTAAYFTGYDLIRNADVAFETYLAAYKDDPDSVDTKTTREHFRQSIEEIRKIHGFRMERVF